MLTRTVGTRRSRGSRGQSRPVFSTLRPVHSTARNARGARAALAALLLIILMPAAVAADATLVSSVPAADEVVTTPPPVIVVTFDAALNDLSSIEIVDATGTTVATGVLDSADPLSLRAVTPDLANGDYEVRWTAGTDDGHLLRGTFSFSIATPAAPTAPPVTPEPSAVATNSPTAAPTVEPTPDPTATSAPITLGGSEGSVEGADVLVPIIAAFAFVAIGLGWFLRRRGAA